MEATIIYPHQLFKDLPAVADGRLVYLVEEPLLLTHNPIHRQKLMLHKLSMDAFERELASAGITVTRLTIADHPKTAAVFTKLKQDGVTKLHIVDTTDCYLERAIAACGIERVWYDSPQFILPKSDACARFATSKKFMASFYKQLRKDKNILINSDGEPTGGKWSFDEENRKKIPKGTELPEDLRKFGNAETGAAENWTEAVEAEKYGAAGCWLPYTHTGAEEFLQEFFCTRMRIGQPTSSRTVFLSLDCFSPVLCSTSFCVAELSEVLGQLGTFWNLFAVLLVKRPFATGRFTITIDQNVFVFA